MTILDSIKGRRSIRDFQEREVPEQAVEALIDALLWAPSAGNLQSRKFYFVFNRETKKKIAKAAFGQDFISRATLVVVACTDRRISARYGDRGVNLYSIQDAAASVMNMMLAAHELGLGTVWVGAFNEFDVFEVLDLPENIRPVAIIPVGYPTRTPPAPPRVRREEAVTFVR
jgi:nitroreductase